jgi:hypothetical protein
MDPGRGVIMRLAIERLVRKQAKHFERELRTFARK